MLLLVILRLCLTLAYKDCNQLTDSESSVFELANLPKLMRIGLTRLNNLVSHQTLERVSVHLSYCDQITLLAMIHGLLQRLPPRSKADTSQPDGTSRLSQQFCRTPPRCPSRLYLHLPLLTYVFKEFNAAQRSRFRLFSRIPYGLA